MHALETICAHVSPGLHLQRILCFATLFIRVTLNTVTDCSLSIIAFFRLEVICHIRSQFS